MTTLLAPLITTPNDLVPVLRSQGHATLDANGLRALIDVPSQGLDALALISWCGT